MHSELADLDRVAHRVAQAYSGATKIKLTGIFTLMRLL
jgi:hypothetical protein